MGAVVIANYSDIYIQIRNAGVSIEQASQATENVYALLLEVKGKS